MSSTNAATNDYVQFTRAIANLVPVRLNDYKPGQMERRIRDFAQRHQAPDLGLFATLLRQDAHLRHEFEQHITINVSEFYRNPETFSYFEEHILPRLLAHRRGLRIWSAGCSYGAEPYTLAMLVHAAAPTAAHRIIATDIDRAVLDRARNGTGYTDGDVRGLPARLRSAYLRREGDVYTVSETIRRMIRFSRHDLLHEGITQRFDLVVCRNVVIYFTDEAKDRILRLFASALETDGYLFIGGTETIGRPAQFGLSYVAPCFYERGAA